MTDLIKRQEAIEAVEEGMCAFYDCYVIEKLKEVSPWTMVSVVRCKECKFSESVITSWSTDGKNNVVERLCKVHKWSVKDDDFCSYGVRKGADDE